MACTDDAGRPEVLVSAASSLTDAFREVESAFEARHGDLDVVLNLAGSAALREQILGGASVDVFASANASNMEQVAARGHVSGEARVFARSRMQIAVPPGNPARVRGLDDLANSDLLIGLCAVEVPCGDLARQILDRSGVAASVDTREPNVRALLAKIETGELDAGLVYGADVVSAEGGVEGVEIPAELNAVADYSIAVLAAAPNPEAARILVDFVLSDEGRAILGRHGFSSP